MRDEEKQAKESLESSMEEWKKSCADNRVVITDEDQHRLLLYLFNEKRKRDNARVHVIAIVIVIIIIVIPGYL